MFCEHKAPGFVDVVKEFYANMGGGRGGMGEREG